MTKARIRFARSIQALCIALLIGAGVASGCGSAPQNGSASASGVSNTTQP